MKTSKNLQARTENRTIFEYFNISHSIFSFFSRNRTPPNKTLKGSGLPQTEHLLNDIGFDAQGRLLKHNRGKANR